MSKSLSVFSYSVEIGERLRLPEGKVVVVTDTTVERLYDFGKNVISFSAGEENKTRRTKEQIEDALLARGCGRDICIVAVGGGVVMDVAGYVASTYCRGVPLVLMPTTLLGMVDACIGGKTGVNVPEGKNLIGTFYQPRGIIIATETLRTLPFIEFQNGIAEMIKHGLIADRAYVEFLESHCEGILGQDRPILQKSIYDSLVIKKGIVEKDEKETGLRRLLNCGHTVGHAIEAAMQYRIPHGRAVAIGCVVESHMAAQMGHLSWEDFERVVKLFDLYQINTEMPPGVSVDMLIQYMKMDKKATNGNPRFVVLNGIGSACDFEGGFCTPMDMQCLSEAIRWFNAEAQSRGDAENSNFQII